MKRFTHSLLFLLAFFTSEVIYGQSFAADGQVIGWAAVNPGDPFLAQGGLRYIPQFTFSYPVGKLSMEGEVSADIWGSTSLFNTDSINLDKNLSLYRAWIKLSGEQFEVRAGLQKINFGSASMIRPLMWFDRLDPKDPLQLTTGVYGLLGRYYFLNNANIWLWLLYGNNATKGLEIYPTKKNSLEYGGRAQLPLPIGEMAFTYHHRQAEPDDVLPASMAIGGPCPENRYGFDTKVDLGVGLWFEGALIRQESDILPYNNATLLNAGADYTFDLGNGINVMAEGLFYLQGNKPFGSDMKVVFSGISVNYPLTIIHSISAIVFADFSNKNLYRFINWNMTFDRWSFYLMGFWNPETYRLPGFEQGNSIFSGAGVQAMAVFNY